MNISHLINTQVTVVHLTQSKVTTMINGKLIRNNEGNYMVFPDSYLTSLIKRFLFKKIDSFIMFHWSAVSDYDGKIICIIDYDKETLEEMTKDVKEKKTV